MKLKGEARKLRKANLRIVPACQSVKFPTIPIFRIKKRQRLSLITPVSSLTFQLGFITIISVFKKLDKNPLGKLWPAITHLIVNSLPSYEN